jgi:two-component system, LytTR family, response regulator
MHVFDKAGGYRDAITAFEKRAVDYILKPFAPDRVHEAITHAMERSAEERAVRLLAALENLRGATATPRRTALKVKGRILFEDPAELGSAEARGDYVLLQQRNGSSLLRDSIPAVAEKQDTHGFVRIHRSVLVNASFVDAIEAWPNSEYFLRTTRGNQYHVSRKYKDSLRSLADRGLAPTARLMGTLSQVDRAPANPRGMRHAL